MTTNPSWYLDDPVFAKIWDAASPYTMTSPARGHALYNAVNHIVDRGLRGNIVESGTWRGGSAMIIALTLAERGETERELYLFDTFSGMPEPEMIDVDYLGNPASVLLAEAVEARGESLVWAMADLDQVRENLESTAYPADRIHLIEGDIRKTAAETRTGALALLRLDTNWYSSTASELLTLWPRLVQHGILLIDNYGHWLGARAAVDEFFAGDEPAAPAPVLLQPLDYTGRLVVRTEANRAFPWPARYDFRPPDFDTPDLLGLFPHLEDTDPASCPDPRLRRKVPHIWRTDTREPSRATGVVSVEEAAVLYATASTRAGRRAMEIGSHFGWSTAHLLAAGLEVDAIDPAFGDPVRMSQVAESLAEWRDDHRVTLWAGFSPNIVPAVAATRDEPYAFAFIDGLHSDDGPVNDVLGVEPHLSEDAMLVFHDLTFSDVATAVRLVKSKGWNIRLYNTMQVMAAAWKSGPPPPEYGGDPNHPFGLPEQLRDLSN